MRTRLLSRAIGTGWLGLALAASGQAAATEYAFSTYPLGSAGFGAGVTPPPGIYVTALASHYNGRIGGQIDFGGVVLNAGAEFEAFATGLSGLYVVERTLLGGRVGIGVTVPVGHVDVEATVGLGPLEVHRQTDGAGLGDITTRLQLGWQHGELSHLVYVQGVAPTGRYEVGFAPIIGLNRPGIDTGWAFTWANKATKLQLNGAAGFTFNFENDETDYKSGNEFHFEWAIGYELSRGLVIGAVGYDYRQLTGDSGPGALLAPFKGRVDAVGPGLSYTTLIGTSPLILNMRHYREFDALRRWGGNATFATATIKF
ncbi:MAG: transporter [Hyphomicrobiaceae bacterium]|nr:transporter [Hyphomicrobiaceae bacterium]